MTNKKWLLCLFTYNRPGFLLNMARSIDAFFPWGDRLVIDDGSDNPEQRQILEDIRTWPNWRVETIERIAGRSYGGFYRNMRHGLDTALAEGYDYCFFLEDDQQLVWKKDDYPEYVDSIFATCPDAVQLQPLLFRRVIDYSRHVEFIRSARAYRSNRGFNTTGIWNLAIVRSRPDYRFICQNGDDLPGNSAYWMRHGYRLYLQFDPTVAILPWVSSMSESDFRVTAANRLSTQGKFFLRPLTQEEQNFIQKRSPENAPYQEYFDLSSVNIEKPIWHQSGQNLLRYFEVCRNVVDIENEAGNSPAPIPMLDSWVPTQLPPLQSHLDWNPRARVAAPLHWTSVLPLTLRHWYVNLAPIWHFSVGNYLAYHSLRRRLRAEQRSLPFKIAKR